MLHAPSRPPCPTPHAPWYARGTRLRTCARCRSLETVPDGPACACSMHAGLTAAQSLRAPREEEQRLLVVDGERVHHLPKVDDGRIGRLEALIPRAGLQGTEVEMRLAATHLLKLAGPQQRERRPIAQCEEALAEGCERRCDGGHEHMLRVQPHVLVAVGRRHGHVGAVWHELCNDCLVPRTAC